MYNRTKDSNKKQNLFYKMKEKNQGSSYNKI